MKLIRVHFTAIENGYVDLEFNDDNIKLDTGSIWEMAQEKEANGNAYFFNRELHIESIETGIYVEVE